MEFGITAAKLDRERTGCLVLGVYAGGMLSPPAAAVDAASGGPIDRVIARGDLRGELGTTLLLFDVPGLAAERVLLVGLGPEGELRETGFRAALAAAAKALRTTAAAEAIFSLHELPVGHRDRAWKIEQAELSVMEGMYRFDKLKSKPAEPSPSLAKVVFAVNDGSQSPDAQAAIDRAVAIADGIALARDLGNLPANLCTPSYLADEARALGTRDGFAVTILEQDEIARLGMHSFLAVARGSRQPPKLIVMEYTGTAAGAQPVVLVGKGITFDTGGISMKPPT